MLADLTIKDFLAETAGSAPVPGGAHFPRACHSGPVE